MSRRKVRKVRKVRIVNVECETPALYRWLRMHNRGATIVTEGFAVYDELAWSEALAAARGREIP